MYSIQDTKLDFLSLSNYALIGCQLGDYYSCDILTTLNTHLIILLDAYFILFCYFIFFSHISAWISVVYRNMRCMSVNRSDRALHNTPIVLSIHSIILLYAYSNHSAYNHF